MKRRNLLLKTACSILVVWSAGCAAMGNIKKVSPVLGQSTWTNVSREARITDEVTATPLFNSDVDGSGYIIINQSGNYQLAENINYPLNITADHVTLDLKSYQIFVTSSLYSGIIIDPYRTEIYIHNGYIRGSGITSLTPGVNIGHSCTKITFENVSIIDFDKGLWYAGVDTNNKVTQCRCTNLNFISCRIGMACDWADANIVRSCSSLYCRQSGFELFNSQTNCFYDCTALKTTGTATVAGFKTADGTSNMFQRCTTKQTKTSSTTFGDKACGFLLTGSEIKTKIIESVVNETDVVSTPTALTYGVDLAPVFAWSGYVSGFPASHSWTIGSPKWSPDSKYVLTTYRNTSNGYGSNEFAWNGSTFVYVGGADIGTSASILASDVAWSPDGKFYVVATGDFVGFAGNSPLYAYSFDGKANTALGSTLPTLTSINLAAARFSPNGKFIATEGFGGGNDYLSIWSFNPSATPALVDLGDKNIGAVGAWQSISWSPDGQYIASVISNNVVVYSVSSSGALSAAAVATYAFTGVLSVAWSPTGKYLAAGDGAGKLQLLTFDGTSSLKFVAQATGLSSNNILGLTWSPDGQYIAVPGGDTASTNRVRILQYNGTTTLAVVATSPTNATRMANIAWSPEGKNIVTFDYNSTSGGAVNVHMFNAMYGPANCLIDSCRVCDTQASNFNMGRGLVAGGTNVFINNVSANNGINYSYGIPNVYDGRFEILRAVVQPFDNISVPTTL